MESKCYLSVEKTIIKFHKTLSQQLLSNTCKRKSSVSGKIERCLFTLSSSRKRQTTVQ